MSVNEELYFPPLGGLHHKTYDTLLDIQEQIVHIYYQLCRKNENHSRALSYQVANLLQKFKTLLSTGAKGGSGTPEVSNTKLMKYFVYFYKMIVQTRDIENGKGERMLTYMLLYEWYNYYPILAIYALKVILGIAVKSGCASGSKGMTGNGRIRSFGCWRDVFELCDYIYHHSSDEAAHPFIDACLDLVVDQWYIDLCNLFTGNHIHGNKPRISLISKWIPRERTKLDWIHTIFVHKVSNKLWPHILRSVQSLDEIQKHRAHNLCCRKVRKLLTFMNKQLDIIENQLCNGLRSDIECSNLNAGSLIKYQNSLLNIRSDGLPRTMAAAGGGPEDMLNRVKTGIDMVLDQSKRICSRNIEKYLYGISEEGGHAMDGSVVGGNGDGNGVINENEFYTKNKTYRGNMGMNIHVHKNKVSNIPFTYYVKKALELIGKLDGTCGGGFGDGVDVLREIRFLNKEWSKMTEMFVNLEKFIPILDIANYNAYHNNGYNNDEIYAAIGFACLVCDKTTIGRRILVTTNDIPSWLTFTAEDRFMDMVITIHNEYKNILCSSPCSIIKCMQLIGDTIRDTGICEEVAEKMVLAVFHNKPNAGAYLNAGLGGCSDGADIYTDGEREHPVHGVGSLKSLHNTIRTEMLNRIFLNNDAKRNERSPHYKIPHIIYWNVSAEIGEVLPASIFQYRLSMVSGLSHALLHHFSFMCFPGFREANSIQCVFNILNHHRYDIMNYVFY